MITHATVENYQSIQNAGIDFGMFTVVFGESNKGKSALLRALHAWAYNEAGSAYVTQGEKFAAVTVDVNDHKVTWMKGATGRYVIDEGTADERVFTKIGLAVPPEVQDVTGFRTIDVDGLHLTPQFSDQFDAPFLLRESSGRAARVLAKITKLDVVVTAAGAASKDVKRARGTQTERERELSEKTELLKEFEDLDEREQRITEAETIILSLTDASHTATEAAHRLELLRAAEAKLSIPFVDLTHVDDVLEQAAFLSEIQSHLTALLSADDRLNVVLEDLKRCRAVVKSLQASVDAIKVCETCGQPISEEA